MVICQAGCKSQCEHEENHEELCTLELIGPSIAPPLAREKHRSKDGHDEAGLSRPFCIGIRSCAAARDCWRVAGDGSSIPARLL